MRFFRHLFFPHFTNRYRARLAQNSSLFAVSVILFVLSLTSSAFIKDFPSVLGVSSNISSIQLLSFTNEKRQENGDSSLVIDERLALAAKRKADDMFAKNYWAHNSPTGETPWVFIKGAGYTYVYAGENLARGFTTSKDVIDAWMASPDHRENMLSKNYTDVGFAVEVGKLNGEETVLVVEEFGSTTFPSVPKSTTKTSSIQGNPSEQVLSAPENTVKPLFNSSTFFGTVAKILVGLFIAVFILDMIMAENKKIIRAVGHNIDHIFFMVLILILIIILGRGLVV